MRPPMRLAALMGLHAIYVARDLRLHA
jgi:hypothetical protein